jgi:hypothetical protein
MISNQRLAIISQPPRKDLISSYVDRTWLCYARHDSPNEYHTREAHGSNTWAMRGDFLRVASATL